MWFLSPLFIEGLLQKPSSSSYLPLIGPWPWRHTTRLVMHVVLDLFSKYLNMPLRKYALQAAAVQ